jgi:hypothetical protein
MPSFHPVRRRARKPAGVADTRTVDRPTRSTKPTCPSSGSGAATNRLGFAVQLLPALSGVILGVDEPPFPPLLKLVADQLKVSVESWRTARAGQTRREHWSNCKRCSASSPSP